MHPLTEGAHPPAEGAHSQKRLASEGAQEQGEGPRSREGVVQSELESRMREELQPRSALLVERVLVAETPKRGVVASALYHQSDPDEEFDEVSDVMSEGNRGHELHLQAPQVSDRYMSSDRAADYEYFDRLEQHLPQASYRSSQADGEGLFSPLDSSRQLIEHRPYFPAQLPARQDLDSVYAQHRAKGPLPQNGHPGAARNREPEHYSEYRQTNESVNLAFFQDISQQSLEAEDPRDRNVLLPSERLSSKTFRNQDAFGGPRRDAHAEDLIILEDDLDEPLHRSQSRVAAEHRDSLVEFTNHSSPNHTPTRIRPPREDFRHPLEQNDLPAQRHLPLPFKQIRELPAPPRANRIFAQQPQVSPLQRSEQTQHSLSPNLQPRQQQLSPILAPKPLAPSQ